MDDVEDISCRAAKSVELCHHQLVAGAEEVEDRCQFVTAFPTCGDDRLIADGRAAFGLRPLNLSLKVLVLGRDVRALELRHGKAFCVPSGSKVAMLGLTNGRFQP